MKIDQLNDSQIDHHPERYIFHGAQPPNGRCTFAHHQRAQWRFVWLLSELKSKLNLLIQFVSTLLFKSVQIWNSYERCKHPAQCKDLFESVLIIMIWRRKSGRNNARSQRYNAVWSDVVTSVVSISAVWGRYIGWCVALGVLPRLLFVRDRFGSGLSLIGRSDRVIQ